MLVIACGRVMNEVCAAGFPSCRFVLSIMGFFGMINCYTLRVNLSVAIVAMVNTTYLHELEAATKHINASDYQDPCAPGTEEDVNKTTTVEMEEVCMINCTLCKLLANSYLSYFLGMLQCENCEIKLI